MAEQLKKAIEVIEEDSKKELEVLNPEQGDELEGGASCTCNKGGVFKASE